MNYKFSFKAAKPVGNTFLKREKSEQAAGQSVKKDRRDKFRDIEMLFKELEKGRCIVNEDILTVCKVSFKEI